MKELELLTEWADSITGKYDTRQITEGGNIFKSPGFSKENPQMMTDRINKAEVAPTVEFLEIMTGLDIADNLLGSTGKVASSGDIDIAIDKQAVSKEQLIDRMVQQGVNPDHLQKTGDSVHYMSPIWQSGGEKTNRFVQVDFMFVPDVEFAKWSMSTAPDSTYKGVYLQKLRADLVRTANPDWKWNHFNGVLSRTDNSSVFGFDPDKIAKGLLGTAATRADLESVERVLAALQNNRGDINTQVRDAYRTTLAPRKPGEKPDPNAPQIDEMKIGQASRGVGGQDSKVGREFQHLEDLVYIEGIAGVKRALDRLQQIAQNTKPLEVKWDGSPAIVFGRDESGQFHFGDKYSKGMLTSPKAVYDYYTRSSQTDSRKVFASEMAELFPVYEAATPKGFQGFLEAGLMYKTTPPLNKQGQYYFMPNTVEYAVDKNSELGKRIGKSISGAAATGFFDNLPELGGKRRPVGDTYKAFNGTDALVIIPPKFTEEGAPVDIERLRTISKYAASNAQQIEQFLAPEPGLSDIRSIIYSYVNSQVDNPQNLDKLGHNFAQWVETSPKLSAAKKLKLQQKMTDNARGASAVFKLTQAIMHLKDGIIGHKEQDTLASMGIQAKLKTGEPGGEGFVHDPEAGSGPTKLVNRGGFTRANRLRENEQGDGKTAVVGWGRGMGHSGHMYLAESVIEYAQKIGGTPFFFVSETVGKDDPLLPGEKLAIYQLVFPKYKNIFKTAPTIIPALEEVSAAGFDNLVFIVGADQKNSFGFLSRNKKDGTPVLPFNSVKVMSRQETGSKTSNLEGPRATPMREVLKNPEATTEQKFKYWRDAMPKALTDEQVMAVMKTAAARMNVPIEDNLQEADQPPQGSLYSPLSAATRDKPAPDPRAAMRQRREAAKMRKFMGRRD